MASWLLHPIKGILIIGAATREWRMRLGSEVLARSPSAASGQFTV